jgi:hypothetical protein
MHSSTSSSEALSQVPARSGDRDLSPRAGIIVLCLGLALILIGLEVSSPPILKHFSRIQRRIESETLAANGLHPFTADGRPTILLVGNSLLLEGVQLDALQNNLASQYAVSRLAVEQTQYLDWYFGLRRLLEQGSHPSVIILALATDQMASGLTLGEAFAHRDMSVQDFPSVVREAKLDRTEASDYFLAHWSNWLADKGSIRQDVLILMVPNFRGLAERIADHGSHIHDPSALVGMARQRLPELRDLGQSYGTKIVVLVPPTLRPDSSSEIQKVGGELGLPVWVLSPPGEFPRDLFRDGFHLNDKGSEIFTTRLANQIQTQLGPISNRSFASASKE